MQKNRKITVISLAAAGMLAAGLAQTQSEPMTFFLTSNGSGNGGDLGGLEGADAICQNLAESVGSGDLTWRAYLSTQGSDAVNARDRIGPGPWFNANGNRIATDIDQLHTVMNRISAFTAVDERGRTIPGSGYAPNRHDILTGTQMDGTAYPDGEDMTCKQLDEQQRRQQGQGRSSRLCRMELRPRFQGLQPGIADRHRRRWPVLLLCSARLSKFRLTGSGLSRRRQLARQPAPSL